MPADQLFDLVVIDEGSQLKIAEAAIAINRVHPASGRLVIAGDDRQLGPIIKGRYAAPGEATPVLFTSIFEYLHQADRDRGEYTSQLLECFRLNDALCRFPAALLYGERFCPANATVAARRLRMLPLSAGVEQPGENNTAPLLTREQPREPSRVRVLEVKRPRKVWFLEDNAAPTVPLTTPESHDSPRQPQMVADSRPNSPSFSAAPQFQAPWLPWIIDPNYSLVLLMLQEVPAVVENPIEAGIVADLTMALRRCLLQDDHAYRQDRDFWQQGLFIVSPHHIQIHAIVQELQRRRRWDYPPFVDTVDKMQGQESECAIISYGVADIDYALQEGEFIYSLRRLNVALTRARSKTIVCLPAPLITPPLSAFAYTDFIDGLNFMIQLRDFVDSHGEKREYPLSQVGEAARLVAWRYC